MSSNNRKIVLALVIAGILIVGIGLILHLGMPGKTTDSTSTSQSGTTGSYLPSDQGNVTAVATFVSTFTAQTSTLFSTTTSVASSSSSSSESTTTSSTYSFSSPPSGSFTYSPNLPVKVLAVNATLNQAGNETVSCSV